MMLDVDCSMIRELISAPRADVVLADLDLVYLAFLLANVSPQAPSVSKDPSRIVRPRLSPPNQIIADHMAAILTIHGFSPSRPPEDFTKRLLIAARADSETYFVDRRLVSLTSEPGYWETARAIVARPSVRRVWGMQGKPRSEASRHVRFQDTPAPLPPAGAPSGRVLDITPKAVRDVLSLPNAEAILADGDLLVLSFMLAAGFKPSSTTAFSADELAIEIEQSTTGRSPLLPAIRDRLRAAARAMDMFDISLLRRRIRLERPDDLKESIADIVTRPLIRRRIESIQQEERARALQAAAKEQQAQKAERPREPREKPPEVPPPPPLVKAEVQIAGVTEAEILQALGDAVIPRVKLEREPVRPAHARASAERFLLRNGLVEVGPIAMGTASYLVARLGFTVDADEQSEGEALLVVSDDGGEPDDALDLSHEPADPPRGQAPLSAEMTSFLTARARGAVERAAQPLLSAVSGRHARAHGQSVARYGSLEAALGPDRTGAEIARLTAERESDIEMIRERFAARVTCTRIACSRVVLPAATIAVTLRRRKATRTITLRVPAGANRVDRLCCEGCGRAAMAAPAACDGKMHLLCEACAPAAQGRIACPLCG
jgi:hypothetical protein